MNRYLAILCFCLFATQCQAVPQLLASFHQTGTLFGNGYEDLPVAFQLYDSVSGNVIGFHGFYNEANNGQSITVDAATRDAMASRLTNPDAYVSAATGNVFSYVDSVSRLWDGGLWSTFVPQRGPGLTGYLITDITQSFANIHHGFGAGSPYVSGEQTVGVYGEVSEPATLVLSFGILAILNIRRRKSVPHKRV